jgi:hypothetical protein
MMKLVVPMVGIVSLLFSPLVAKAAGSVTFEGVKRLVLSQDPGISEVITKALDVEPVGAAMRIGGRFPHGGCRIGPYTFMAKPKGQGSERPLKLTIFADTKFVDATGNPDGSSKATHMIILLQGILLTPVEPGSDSIASTSLAGVLPVFSSQRVSADPIQTGDGCFP